jgi:hypothetical protein
MNMIAHDDAAEGLPVVADGRLLETVDQPSSVRIIADDLLPGIAPRHMKKFVEMRCGVRLRS